MLLAYDDYGPGPVVVLLHGFPLNRTMWSAQETSVGSIYRVIAPDLRGHGESAAPEGVYTMDEMADDVIELLDALQTPRAGGPGRPVDGGLRRALGRWSAYPERFRALMLMDTRAAADTPEAARNREELASQVEASGRRQAVVDGDAPEALLADHPRAAPRRSIAPIRAVMDRTLRRAVAGALRGMAARPDRTADLSGIERADARPGRRGRRDHAPRRGATHGRGDPQRPARDHPRRRPPRPAREPGRRQRGDPRVPRCARLTELCQVRTSPVPGGQSRPCVGRRRRG